jgi:flagellar protein FlgJ
MRQTRRPEAPDGGRNELQRLRKACEEFEALFIQELLKGLRRTTFETLRGPRSIYQSMMDEEVARVCARRGLGLAELLLSRLKRELGNP